MTFIKKVFYNLPIDFFILFMPYILSAIAVLVFKISIIIPLIFLSIFIIYAVINIILTEKRYEEYKYLFIMSPFFSKNKVFIIMFRWKNREANIGTRSPKGASEKLLFMFELDHFVKVLQERAAESELNNITCYCCTHDTIIKSIERIDNNVLTKEVYKGTLTKVKEYIDVKDDGKEVPFYKTRFNIKKNDN